MAEKVANDITAALQMIEIARDDAEIQGLLGPRGYDAAALDDAIADFQAPAQAAYDGRQRAIGVLNRAQQALEAMQAQEQKDFTDYREIARATFKAAGDRASLGLNGTAPKDLEKFITAAKASYGTGKKAPFTELLTKRGYSPAAIDAELAGIDGVSGLANAVSSAQGRRKGRRRLAMQLSRI